MLYISQILDGIENRLPRDNRLLSLSKSRDSEKRIFLSHPFYIFL